MRAQDIAIRNNNEFYEVIGYLARQGRLVSIDAEIPNSQIGSFVATFGNVPFTPVDDGITASGMPGKVGPQYRINLATRVNCPAGIINSLGAGRGTNIAARINKSAFVEKLVRRYGFSFGSRQNIANIRATVPQEYLVDFERGLNR